MFYFVRQWLIIMWSFRGSWSDFVSFRLVLFYEKAAETPALSSRESEEFSISLCLRLREHPPPPFYANCPMFVFVPSSPVRSFYIGHPMYRYSRCTCHTILLWMDPRFREHQLCLMFSRRSLLSVNPKLPSKRPSLHHPQGGEHPRLVSVVRSPCIYELVWLLLLFYVKCQSRHQA
jgi:hypothetical protein